METSMTQIVKRTKENDIMWRLALVKYKIDADNVIRKNHLLDKDEVLLLQKLYNEIKVVIRKS